VALKTAGGSEHYLEAWLALARTVAPALALALTLTLTLAQTLTQTLAPTLTLTLTLTPDLARRGYASWQRCRGCTTRTSPRTSSPYPIPNPPSP